MLQTLKRAALALACSLVASAAAAATPTTNYNLQKPQVGADSDQWGTYINGDLDSLDSIIFGIQGTANAACPKAGCTFTGGITGTTATFSGASSFGSTLGVTGLLSAAGGEAITGNLTVSGTTTDTGLVTMNGGLTVASGATSLGGTLGVTGNVTFSGGLGVSGNVAAAGLQATANGLNVTGGFTLNNGPLTLPAGSITGGEIANGTIASANIANSAVTNAQHANMVANTIKGNATGSSAAPQDLNVTQVVTMLGMLFGGNGSSGAITIPTNSGNVIINWGTAAGVSTGGNSNPITFLTTYGNGEVAFCSGTSGACSINSLNNSQITVHNSGGGAQNIYWITIGQ